MYTLSDFKGSTPTTQILNFTWAGITAHQIRVTHLQSNDHLEGSEVGKYRIIKRVHINETDVRIKSESEMRALR